MNYKVEIRVNCSRKHNDSRITTPQARPRTTPVTSNTQHWDTQQHELRHKPNEDLTAHTLST